jgi:tetratricopeptide (TPR) repeat protein
MRRQPRYGPGDKIGGRYQVHQALMGGMGEVYLCLDLETIQPYALKTFQQRFLGDPQKLRAIFEQEVATWVALEKHPNIVRCFYMTILDNQPFMILEWIAGEEGKGADLRGWLRRGPLDLRTALDFSIDICRGLIHAQQKQPGMVHRDLKPENILIAQGRLAKITDFGLAQIVQSAELEISRVERGVAGRQSLMGQEGIVGTPPYMAPEQWRGERLDARTDIYALGCILYEMLTGGSPFKATTLNGLRRQHLEAATPKLATSQDLPSGLDTLLAGCLAKRREERLATAGDLLQQLVLIYQQEFAEPPKAIPIGEDFTTVDYNNRGVTYTNLQYYDEALADYGRAIQLDPTHTRAYSNRGNTYELLQRYDEALVDYAHAIRLDPSYAQAYNNRGVIYYNLQRYDKAMADHNRAIELDPALAEAYNNRGNTLSSLQCYDEALADYTQTIQLAPSYARAYVNRGLTYAKLQRNDEALADYTRAIQLDPTFAPAYFNRGNTYRNLQQYDEALADYSRVIQLDPNYASAYHYRGFTHYNLRQYNEGLTDLTQAIQLDSTNAQAFYNRGLIHTDFQQYEEALVDFSQAIQLDPTNAQAYNNRGSTYRNLQQEEKALTDYDKAIQLDPTLVEVYTNRGNTHRNLRRYDEALADYSQAIQLDPDYIQAYYNRSLIYYSLQRYKEAVADLDQVIQLDPDYPQAFNNRGLTHADPPLVLWTRS